ncbi:hypothetical protein GJ699_00835 [Duganella sp. FT80W]|uniref:Chorismate-utilising enzyme C-terminal domain-containing protein n=1 Tax=Duganella guangzhouensis TaxID=2666084 RepID=A0A6I2KVW2_9BURK|nr:hypothetical protein [Duganella guangzhouensis]
MSGDAVFALLDDADPARRSRLYLDHAGTLACLAINEWPALLAALDAALQQGLYAVPVCAYELGGQLLEIPATARATSEPLAQILLFRSVQMLDGAEVDAWLAARASAGTHAAVAGLRATPAGIVAVQPSVDQAAFTRSVERILAYIAAGDVYQVNYTLRLHVDVFGPAPALYALLRARQPVPYGALIALPDGRCVLSLSPELFIRHRAGKLQARPMKGTATAGDDDATNAQHARRLAADPKNRAENLMIVDLLRNDLGRIARTGSVRVPALFDIQRYGKVLQMTSTVEAELAPHATLGDIFQALYPCGSITGAPKRRAMEIIRELEPDARGIYTGAVGWIDPGGDFCLSVPIRTLVLPPGDGPRQGRFGVGAGIVHDSDPALEVAECQLKASFLTGLVKPS